MKNFNKIFCQNLPLANNNARLLFIKLISTGSGAQANKTTLYKTFIIVEPLVTHLKETGTHQYSTNTKIIMKYQIVLTVITVFIALTAALTSLPMKDCG